MLHTEKEPEMAVRYKRQGVPPVVRARHRARFIAAVDAPVEDFRALVKLFNKDVALEHAR